MLVDEDENSFIADTDIRKKGYKQRFWRWVQMGMMIVFFIANYMSYMVMPSLQEQVTEALDTTSKGYNELQASYSFPNMISPFLAGLLIDKIGMRVGIIGYTTLMVIGMGLEYIAATQGSYWTMLGGIMCFGIGSEAMCIIISSFAASWFMGKELSLGLGVTTASANFGSVLANWILPPIYNINHTINLPFLITFLAQCGGLGAAFVMCGIDKAAERDEKQRKALLLQESSNSVEKSLLETNGSKIEVDLTETETKKESIKCSDIKKLNITMFWLINGVYCFLCASMIPFQNNLQNILITFYGLDTVPAGRVLSLITLQTALLTPIFAAITDKIGRRSELLLLSSIISTGSFVIWMVLPTCQDGGCHWYYLPIIINGFGTSVFSAIVYPAIPLVVEHDLIGTAFGIQDCAQQIGMFIAPLAAGPIMNYGQRPSVNSYFWFYFFFFSCGCVGVLISVWILVYDKKHGNKLNAKEGEYEQKAGVKSIRSCVKKSVIKSIR